MGVVYLARDLRIGRRVALKTLRRVDGIPDAGDSLATESVTRFKREAQVCASLLHPNIVTLYEIGSQADRFVWMAMEFVDGESLAAVLERRGRVPLDTAVRIAHGVLSGLALAHERGVVHRDIKPANVLIAANGAPKIADFGIARATDANLTDLTDRGRLIGTPHYMSPEQIAGRRVDGRSDLFAVGVLFYEMVSGRKPFDSASLTDVLYSVVNRPAPSLRSLDSSIPQWCVRWTERMLEKSPDRRWPDAATAARELVRLAGMSGEVAAPTPIEGRSMAPGSDLTPTTPLAMPSIRRVPWHTNLPTGPAIASIAILLTAVAGGVAWSVRELTRESATVVTVGETELAERQQILREAELLYEARAYREALQRYDAYLERWPESRAALEGKANVEAALTRVTNLRGR